MGGLAEWQISNALNALAGRNAKLAHDVIKRDSAVDRLQTEIEQMIVAVIARQKPVAIDLRETICALQIAKDLERIGDLAKNISKHGLAIGTETLPRSMLRGLKHMTQIVLEQVQRALDSFSSRDGHKARTVRHGDVEIDRLHESLSCETIAYMSENTLHLPCCIHVLFCIKDLERIGDHAVSIAGTVRYIVEGGERELESA